jgi:hypothetical protein
MILPASGVEISPFEWPASFLPTGQLIVDKPSSRNLSQNSTYLHTSRSVRSTSPSTTRSMSEGQMERRQSEGGPRLMDLQQARVRWGQDRDVILLRITWEIQTGRKLLEWVSGSSFCRKYTNLCGNDHTGLSLLRKVKEAIPMHATHSNLLEQLESVINQSVLDVWVKEVEAWENDNENPNPFAPRWKCK